MLRATTLMARSPGVRHAIRAIARLVNPLVLLVAGRRWMPILGIVHHRGRSTGRQYSTPLGMRPLGGALVVPRTFGAGAAWYRNLVAAGWVEVTYRGRTWRVGTPQLRDLYAVAAAFPRYERSLIELLGIDDFVVLRHMN
jgi:deazaflavin-dependent oxidoreductase (nitroreductase family)